MGLLRDRCDPADLSHAPLRGRLSLPSRAAGTNLGKTDHYAGENRDPLQLQTATSRRSVFDAQSNRIVMGLMMRRGRGRGAAELAYIELNVLLYRWR